ncbi:MAG: hypothetical protein COS29_03095 [Candidatus Omnitrophica bacterium CG02_land_8_20_14_3_00__42_8]|nr:MAG: hypothetical protein COS29_03095 [Candidatus Omnitrophica bacterium CG02_land_8_20_14_3_00__42_8]
MIGDALALSSPAVSRTQNFPSEEILLRFDARSSRSLTGLKKSVGDSSGHGVCRRIGGETSENRRPSEGRLAGASERLFVDLSGCGTPCPLASKRPFNPLG